jgi:hypothetical protein
MFVRAVSHSFLVVPSNKYRIVTIEHPTLPLSIRIVDSCDAATGTIKLPVKEFRQK